MEKNLKLSNINEELTLLIEQTGTVMETTKEENRAYLIENYGEEEVREYEEEVGIDATYEKVRSAVYKCWNDNIVILASYCFDQDNETLPEMENMISFLDDCLADKLQKYTNLIVYIYQVFGTTLDYVLIFDDCFYEKVLETNHMSIVGDVIEYVQNSKTDENGHCWKYAQIINGEYSRYL